jgi:hypothetical protein
VAKGFVVDTGKAQQVGDRLTSVGKAIEGLPPGPKPRGQLGSGVIERAWSEFEQSFAAARQNLVKSVNDSARGFTGLAKNATSLDQRKAEEAEKL